MKRYYFYSGDELIVCCESNYPLVLLAYHNATEVHAKIFYCMIEAYNQENKREPVIHEYL